MYQQEDKATREAFKVICVSGVSYIWAYTLEEAQQTCRDRGLVVIE
jgi:hypothetical protein